MLKGDIVLVSFPFTDLSGSKLRPAIILYATNLDMTVCFVTTQIEWREATDIILNPSELNGLKSFLLLGRANLRQLTKN